MDKIAAPTPEQLKKQEALKQYFEKLGSVAVAFSSGVDSTYLLKVAHDVLGERAIAVTASSCSFPKRELGEAEAFCRKENIRHFITESEELEIEGFAQNPKNRCYLCKHELFEKILKIAEEQKMYLTKSFQLPCSIGYITQNQYRKIKKEYTREEVKKLAWHTLQRYEEKLMQKGVQISANNVKIEIDHKTCVSKGFLEIIEKIGEETPVEIPEQPAERTTEDG